MSVKRLLHWDGEIMGFAVCMQNELLLREVIINLSVTLVDLKD